jgi:hypothetical protein
MKGMWWVWITEILPVLINIFVKIIIVHINLVELGSSFFGNIFYFIEQGLAIVVGLLKVSNPCPLAVCTLHR